MQDAQPKPTDRLEREPPEGNPARKPEGKPPSLSGERRSPLSGGAKGEAERFLYIPYDERLKEKARENRKRPTRIERRMWNEVLCRKSLSGYKFVRQKPLERFIADFYCSELRLVIEIDGDSHADQVEYDNARTEFLNAYGINVIRFTNQEVEEDIEGVYQRLADRIASDHLRLAPPDKGERPDARRD